MVLIAIIATLKGDVQCLRDESGVHLAFLAAADGSRW